jgi:hypothetical protein
MYVNENDVNRKTLFYKCSKCSNVALVRISISRNLNMKGKKINVCQHCHEHFATSYALRRHKKLCQVYLATQPPGFVQTLCGKRVQSQYLRRHTRGCPKACGDLERCKNHLQQILDLPAKNLTSTRNLENLTSTVNLDTLSRLNIRVLELSIECQTFIQEITHPTSSSVTHPTSNSVCQTFIQEITHPTSSSETAAPSSEQVIDDFDLDALEGALMRKKCYNQCT